MTLRSRHRSQSTQERIRLLAVGYHNQLQEQKKLQPEELDDLMQAVIDVQRQYIDVLEARLNELTHGQTQEESGESAGDHSQGDAAGAGQEGFGDSSARDQTSPVRK